MKKNRFFIVLLTLLLAAWASAPAHSQDRPALALTLEDCLRLALNQNPFYLASQERIAGARAQLSGAASGFFPQLTAAGLSTLDEKLFVLEFPSIIPGQPPTRMALDFTKDYQFSLSLNLPLFAGGRLIAGYKQATYNMEATKETVRQSRQDTVFNVKSSFYGYLLAREFVAVSQESLALAQKHFKNIKDLYELGLASKFDLLRAEVQVTNLKPPLLRARNGLALAELGLKSLLGLDLKQAVEIKGELAYAAYEPDPESCTAQALLHRPELNQMLYQKRMAAEMVKLARGAYFPTLAISGSYNYWADAFNFRKNTWQSYYSVNLVLSVPLFNGFATAAQVGQSQALLRELELTHKGLVESVRLEVQLAILNLGQARESLLSQEKNVEQAQESVRIAELNYAQGLATSLDVSSVQVALTQAKTNYSQALFDYVLSLAQLQRATGMDETAK